MHDDEINELLQMMKDAGIPQVRLQRTLEVLGHAEKLGMELREDAAPSVKQRVREMVAAALLRIFRENSEASVK